MKRFWTAATSVADLNGYAIRVDGKPVSTPGRAELVVPTRALAEAIVAEWNAIEGDINPAAMPLTGLANAAIDRIAADKEGFAKGIAAYGESDLFCYRAQAPKPLADAQEEAWGPLIAWARRRYDADFHVTHGIVHVAQPGASLERLAHEVHALGEFALAGLAPLVTIGGSLVAGLAVLDHAATPEAAFEAVTLDERWQAQQWGADSEAEAALALRRADFMAAARFLELLAA